MTPLLSDEICRLLAQSMTLRKWVDCYGSPLHITLPNRARANAVRWIERLTEVYPRTEIRYATKACKARSLTMAVALAGTGADVTSAAEFTRALGCYVPARSISMTGPP